MSGYIYPAVNLINLFPPDSHASFLAEQFGVGRATIVRWRNEGAMLNEHRADQYACKVGKHPFEVWPSWFLDVCA